MKTKTVITESELNHCEALIEQYHDHHLRGRGFAESLADTIGCSTSDAYDILDRYDTMQNVLAKCAIGIAPDDRPQLHVVHPPADSTGERVELAVIAMIACAFGAVVVWCWGAWWWGE